MIIKASYILAFVLFTTIAYGQGATGTGGLAGPTAGQGSFASLPIFVYPGTGATWNIGTGGLGTPSTPLSVAGVVGGTPVPVTGTFSATLGGFAPSGNYATLAVTTSTGNVALPAGSPAVVVVYNTGSNPVYVKLGTSNAVTATTGDDYIPAGGAMALTVGSNTYLAAISTGGSTSINLSGGSGLATGWGGGSGGGGTVAQGYGAGATPWTVTLPSGASPASSQISCVASATQLLAASTSYAARLLSNQSGQTVYLGGAGVTTVNGFPFPTGSGFDASHEQGVLYCVAGSSATVGTLQY